MFWQRLGASLKRRFSTTELPSENPSLIPLKKKNNVNLQHKVKQFSVIKITSVRDMEISPVPVSKSLGNCEHLYDQMSSVTRGVWKSQNTVCHQSHAAGSVHFSWQHFIKYRGLCTGITLCTKPSYFYTYRHTREAEEMFNLWCSSWTGLNRVKSVEGVEKELS